MSRSLLLEVGTEELPPSELPAILRALEEGAGRALEEARLGRPAVEVLSSPRRLAVLAQGLDARQARQRVAVIGPPRKAAFDASRRPTRAAEGFARSQGVSVDALRVVETERGEYLAADREEGGQPAEQVLPPLLERLVMQLPFARQMRWGDGDVRFSRPIRWVVALLDGDVLPLTVAGVAAGRVTRGHRFLAPDPIELATPGEYVAALRRARVLVDVGERREAVRAELRAAGAAQGFEAVVDEATLEAVVHLVEWPMAVVGRFAERFLDLPRQVVETPIRRHQRCFTVEGPDGALRSQFIAVSNMPGTDPREIRRGNERVIGARLADADFYFREDLRLPPEERLPRLASMVFQERLGTLLEKTERVGELAAFVAAAVAPRAAATVARAARLAKADLASGMVREFPELQGIIGEEYARRAGEPAAVARAIREQYLPRGAEDELPASVEGAVLAIADKLDTVAGCLGVGLTPTGSQDPYALRRQAQGVVQIILAMPFALSLPALVDRALALLGPRLTEPAAAVRDRVLDFFGARLAMIMTGRGLRGDVVDAVLCRGVDEPVRALGRAEALTALMGQPDWDALATAFKRAINILPERPLGVPDPERFVDEAERRLFEETQAARPGVARALAAGDYAGALGALARLRPSVDRFFEAVLVMDKDAGVRDNRLAVLKGLADLVLPIADLRRIQATP